MLWKEYAALAIFVAWLLAIGASEHKKGAITVAPVRTRSFKDIMTELLGPQVPLLNQVTGTIVTLDGMNMTLKRRDGTLAIIEFLRAAESPEFPPLGTGKAITAIGKTDGDGILHAEIVTRARDSATLWPKDQ